MRYIYIYLYTAVSVKQRSLTGTPEENGSTPQSPIPPKQCCYFFDLAISSCQHWKGGMGANFHFAQGGSMSKLKPAHDVKVDATLLCPS